MLVDRKNVKKKKIITTRENEEREREERVILGGYACGIRVVFKNIASIYYGVRERPINDNERAKTTNGRVRREHCQRALLPATRLGIWWKGRGRDDDMDGGRVGQGTAVGAAVHRRVGSTRPGPV